MRDMTEIELKLTLLRYNVLSKEESIAASEYMRAGETASYEDELFKRINEMTRMEDDLRKDGYKFTCIGSRTEDRVRFNVYRIVPVDNC